ncbi:hypothetical protein FRB90_010987 [Tulasnella sp. 427]|nr:hypothetical protein FRB90_010987 [Tulasnella sp. 427]
MSSIKCPVCFENHSSQIPFCTIKCGHIFCQPCLQSLSQFARTNRQQLFCPKCRAPFREGPPDVFELYPEYDSDDESAPAPRNDSFSNEDRQDVEQLVNRADNIDGESEAAELEGVVVRGEQLLERFRDGGARNENAALLASMDEHFSRLRQHLCHQYALEDLHEQVANLTAERDEYRNQLDAQHAKYIEAKDVWQHEVAELKEIVNRGERDRVELAKEASRRVSEIVRPRMAAKADLQELQKKHAKCKQARPYLSSKVNDSREIRPPPKPLGTFTSFSSPHHTSLDASLERVAMPLRKLGSASTLSHPLLNLPKRPLPRTTSRPSASRDAENVQPYKGAEQEDASALLSQAAASSRPKPTALALPRLRPTPMLMAPPKVIAASPLFRAPLAKDTQSKGKERSISIPSSDEDIQKIKLSIPSLPPCQETEVFR